MFTSPEKFPSPRMNSAGGRLVTSTLQLAAGESTAARVATTS